MKNNNSARILALCNWTHKLAGYREPNLAMASDDSVAPFRFAEIHAR
jgi:hypothetical protein